MGRHYSGDPATTRSSTTWGRAGIVSLASPALATTAGGRSSGPRHTLTDSAALTGATTPTGTITFTLYAPDSAVVDTETVPVNGNSTYTTSTGYTPTAPGTYQWVASYSGDANDDPVGATRGAPRVSRNPAADPGHDGGSVVRGQRSLLTVDVVGRLNPTGTITFTLYAPKTRRSRPPTQPRSTATATTTRPSATRPAQAGTYQCVATL